MFRRMLMGIVAIAGIFAGAKALLNRRGARGDAESAAVQWPFDSGELRTLMDRVIDEQRDRISSIEDAAGRARARSFLEYYERRRQAAVS